MKLYFTIRFSVQFKILVRTFMLPDFKVGTPIHLHLFVNFERFFKDGSEREIKSNNLFELTI